MFFFQTNLISVETLAKTIDPSQLTSDFDGTLAYDHNTWIELRLAVEDFTWQANELLDQLEDVRDELQQSDFADDVNGAKRAIERHKEMHQKVTGNMVHDLDLTGQRLLQRSVDGMSRVKDYAALILIMGRYLLIQKSCMLFSVLIQMLFIHVNIASI